MTPLDISAPHLESPHHVWPRKLWRAVPACEAQDGNDRTERACALCGLVKITVHPPHGLAWRRWRTAEGLELDLSTAPPCRPRQDAAPTSCEAPTT